MIIFCKVVETMKYVTNITNVAICVYDTCTTQTVSITSLYIFVGLFQKLITILDYITKFNNQILANYAVVEHKLNKDIILIAGYLNETGRKIFRYHAVAFRSDRREVRMF